MPLPALYNKPQPRNALSLGVIHFCELGGVPNELYGVCIRLQGILKEMLNRNLVITTLKHF